MKKKFNLTAILAVVMVAMLSINLVSCTADEEYGDLAFGTLAEGMFTRSGGDPGWGGADDQDAIYTKTITIKDILFQRDTITCDVDVTFTINYSKNKTNCEILVEGFTSSNISSGDIKILPYQTRKPFETRIFGKDYVCFTADMNLEEYVENDDFGVDTLIYHAVHEGRYPLGGFEKK